jgi:hypothetical protein
MHNVTKTQKANAVRILGELRNAEVPDLVTAREASMLCERYGVTNDRFRRVAKAEQNFRPFNLAQVAMEIARKGGK